MGKDSSGVSGAGHLLYRPVCRLHRGHSFRPTPPHYEAGPQDQSTSSASTARSDSDARGWCVPPCRSPRTSPTTSVQSAIAFVTITSPKVRHYQDNTTQTKKLLLRECGLSGRL